jgi:hypothetical protein
MKGKLFAHLSVILSFILVVSSSSARAQTKDPWTDKQLMDPQLLSAMIANLPADQLPVIFNVGPTSAIKGAILLGPTGKEAGIAALTARLKDIPKDKQIIIYCGCCPFFKCPNIRPAFSLLVKEGFTNIHLLNLTTNLKIDWIDKGYPVEKDL